MMILNSKQKWMNLLKELKTKSTYQKINLTIAAVLIVVLLLLFLGIVSGVVQCPYKSQYGISCASCGISRDIFSYLKLDFSSPLNPNSLKVFLFFLCQIFLRIGLWMSKATLTVIRIDIIVSIIWIAWIFGALLFS